MICASPTTTQDWTASVPYDHTITGRGCACNTAARWVFPGDDGYTAALERWTGRRSDSLREILVCGRCGTPQAAAFYIYRPAGQIVHNIRDAVPSGTDTLFGSG